MKAFITGGTGFVGSCLAARLLDEGWDVTITGRSASVHAGRNGLTHLKYDTTQKGDWQDLVADADVIFNLAGKNIFTHWSADNKREIRESRIQTTKNVVDAIPAESSAVLLSTSAAGYYGNRGDEILNEDSSKGTGFLSDLCEVWEAEAMKAEEKGVRTVLMRFSMILGKEGGALKMMLNPFKFGAGGTIGSGTQWVSWMHIDDLVSAMLHAVANENARGPLNFCSPFSVRNKDFTQALARALNRPSFLSVPAFMLKTALGELGEVLLGSQRMASGGLNGLGFEFAYPEIGKALEHLVK
jgi:uncharacterized protein (TIGR01777 family)